MSESSSIVETVDLVKHYGSMTALDGLSFALAKGSLTGLLGPNGAGKTTLLKTLLGFLPHSSGSCRVLGHSPASAPLLVRRRLGFMAENDLFFPGLTGLEAVVYSGRLSGMDRESAFSRAHEVLDYLGMDEVRHRPVAEYSRGLKQKIKLGQAVVHGPSLCFLDEPFSGLDPQSRTEMMELLAGIAAGGLSLLVSSHVLRDIETLCPSVLVLNRGRLLYSGATAGLRRADRGHFLVKLGGAGADQLVPALTQLGFVVRRRPHGWELETAPEVSLSPLWEQAVACGCQVRELRPLADSLEQAFLRLLDQSPPEAGAHG